MQCESLAEAGWRPWLTTPSLSLTQFRSTGDTHKTERWERDECSRAPSKKHDVDGCWKKLSDAASPRGVSNQDQRYHNSPGCKGQCWVGGSRRQRDRRKPCRAASTQLGVLIRGCCRLETEARLCHQGVGSRGTDVARALHFVRHRGGLGGWSTRAERCFLVPH